MTSDEDIQRAQDALLGKSPQSIGPHYYHRSRGKTFRHARPSDSGRLPVDLVEEFKLITGADEGGAGASIIQSFSELPLRSQKAALKRIKAKTRNFDDLYNVMLGLPSRVRSFVKKVWKRQDKWGESWEKVASEMAGGANKILTSRVDIVVYTPMAVQSGQVDRDDPKLLKMAKAQAECDAMLTIFAHYFTIGITAHISTHCLAYRPDDPVIAGLADVADYGSFDHGARKLRQQIALQSAAKNGWKVPTRAPKK